MKHIGFPARVPTTRAELTLFWFMWGYRFDYPPQHCNCRCILPGVRYD